MQIDPDSFKGKLYLLVIDKLVLGALIALAFVIYDQWKTSEARQHEVVTQRPALLKELVPIIADPDADIVVRAHALTALIEREAIGARSAFALTERLLRSGLIYSELPHEDSIYLRPQPEEHFLSDALFSFMPDAFPELLDQYMTSSAPGSMSYESEVILRVDDEESKRYRQSAPAFWRGLILKALQQLPDSKLGVLNDDSFLARGYLSVLHRAIGPYWAYHYDWNFDKRDLRALRALHSIDIIKSVPSVLGIDEEVYDGLKEQQVQYILSLVECPISEHRRMVINDIMRIVTDEDVEKRIRSAVESCA